VRTTFYDLLERLEATGDLREPVVELGASRASGQAHLPAVGSMFPGRAFIGVDMHPGQGVDQLHNLHSLGFRDGSIGTAIMFDTIEHVEDPTSALTEIRRCLAPDGVLLLTTVFLFPIHPYPADYWRFTAEGVAALLKDFDRSHTGEAGLRLLPHTVVGLAGGPSVDPESWRRLSRAVDDWLREGATSWKERALAWLPPILLQRGYERYSTSSAQHSGKS
jgi:SAM-dependent methyltransferase